MSEIWPNADDIRKIAELEAQLKSGEYYYTKGIGTGLAIALEIVENLRPTTSDAIHAAIKRKLEAVYARAN